jgi:predicted AAA+ superfamily ATPase
MLSKPAIPEFQRSYGDTLAARLAEPVRFLQVVSGPRQVGKTTLVRQVAAGLGRPVHFASADDPLLRDPAWIGLQWQAARSAASREGGVLVLDEVQKIPAWSDAVKGYWDEDRADGRPLHVIVLGSSPLLMQRGLTESLAGRFEQIHLPHWSFGEMREAFGFSLEQFVFHGGYPGAAPLVQDPDRWRRYILDSLIETTISRDVLLLTRVDKPVLLRRLLELGCRYSGQVLSYTKMIGQLQEAGNTTTLAHYLELLAGAGMLVGLQKYAGSTVRQRGSSPKLQVLNNALMTASSGRMPDAARADSEYWGRLVESAAGAHLANAAAVGDCELFYWRQGNHEVDFVVRIGRDLVAVEVKSGRSREALSGLVAFGKAWKPKRMVLVGEGGMELGEFLSRSVKELARE